MHLSDILPRIPVNALITYIPVLATVVTCYFSVVLAQATLRYVAATDKSLALAREEFEREWSPELHLKFERVSSSEVQIVVTNLAKLSVLLQLLQIRKVNMLVPFEKCVLNDPLVGGMTWSQEMGKRIVTCTGGDFEGQIAACMTFFASGRMFRTDWFRFYIQVERGRIIRIDASNIPARRVRVVTNRQGVERRREVVQDVAAGTRTVQAPDESPVG
jgi:cell division protein FtsL